MHAHASSCVILFHGAWVPLLPRAVRSRGRVIGVCVCVCVDTKMSC